MSEQELRYIPALDGLRAVAVCFVLLAHAADPHLTGGFGVDIFFVLSGFLITSQLVAERERYGRTNFVAFYLRRGIRLYPALLAMLVVLLPAGLLLAGGRVLVDTVSSALYLIPFSTHFIQQPIYTGHLWTLAVEEYFYLVWPALLVLLAKLIADWRVRASVILAVGTLMALGVNFVGDSGFNAYLRAGELAIGGALAFFILKRDLRHRPSPIYSFAFVALLAVATLLSALWSNWNYFFAAAATVAFIWGLSDERPSPVQRLLSLRPVRYVGRISYELYLWHEAIITLASLFLGQERPQIWWWTYPLSFFVAALTHHAFVPLQQRLRQAVRAHFPHREAGRTDQPSDERVVIPGE